MLDEVVRAGAQEITASPTELLSFIESSSAEGFEFLVGQRLRELGYPPERPAMRGAPDFVIRRNDESIGVESKVWRRRPSSGELTRLRERLTVAANELRLAQVIVVTPTDIAGGVPAAGDTRVQLVVFGELENALQ